MDSRTGAVGYNGTPIVFRFLDFREEVERMSTQVAVIDAKVGRCLRQILLLDKGVDLVFHNQVVDRGIASAF